MHFSQIELDRHKAFIDPLKIGDQVRGLNETYCLPGYSSWKTFTVTKVKENTWIILNGKGGFLPMFKFTKAHIK